MEPGILLTSWKDSTIFRSPLRYPGGKQRAISIIEKQFPKSRFDEYREPMVGGGSVYFRAKMRNIADKYWINDKFEELANFWKVVQEPENCIVLIQKLTELRSRLDSPEVLKEYFFKTRDTKRKQPIDAAMHFFLFNRITFSGTTMAGGFSSAASELRFTQSSISRLEPMPIALQDTQITNQDFKEVIEVPGKEVFIFLDPPYFTASKLYGNKGALHEEFDHHSLCEMLKRTPHKFLITYDDCPAIRKMYSWVKKDGGRINKWNLQYGMNNCNALNTSKKGKEIFIANYLE